MRKGFESFSSIVSKCINIWSPKFAIFEDLLHYIITHVQINLVIHELGWKCEDSNCFEFGLCEYDDFDKCLENQDYQWSCHLWCCKPEDIIEDNPSSTVEDNPGK